jgi:hypothetical protein
MMDAYAGITKGDKAPKKEIREMVHTKSHNGKHIVTHRHHSPAHHPDEMHAFNNLAEAKDHMDMHAGEPAEGAAPAEGGPPQMTAAPSGPAPAGPMPGM